MKGSRRVIRMLFDNVEATVLENKEAMAAYLLSSKRLVEELARALLICQRKVSAFKDEVIRHVDF